MAEIKKISYTHDALIDTIIAHPAVSQRELATLFGYTEAWMSQIMSSDSFKVRLEARRKETIDPILLARTEERLEGTANLALEVLQEKLSAGRNPELAVKVLDISTRALGYGARDRSQINLQANFVVALPGKAADGQTWQAEHKPEQYRALPPAESRGEATAMRVPLTIDTEIAA